MSAVEQEFATLGVQELSGVLVAVELDKAEAARAIRVRVAYDCALLDLAVVRGEVLERVLVHGPLDVLDEELSCGEIGAVVVSVAHFGWRW